MMEAKISELDAQAAADGVPRSRGHVLTTPQGYETPSVWLQISNKAIEQCQKALAEFGLSPSARARMTPAAQTPSGDLFAGTPHAKKTLANFGQ